MTLQATLAAQRPVRLTWLAAPVLPAPRLADEMIDFSGRWCGELRANVTPWAPGARFRENRTGRTGHEHFPGLVVPCRGTTNTRGTACGFHYGWSGGHRMVAEELPDGRRQIQFGHAADTEADPATYFETAPALRGPLRRRPQRLRGGVPAPPAGPDREVSAARPPSPGALQLLGGGLLRPRPPAPRGPRHARRRAGGRTLRAGRRLVRTARRRHDLVVRLDGRSPQVPRGTRPADRPRAGPRDDVRPLVRAGDGQPEIEPLPRPPGMGARPRGPDPRARTDGARHGPARGARLRLRGHGGDPLRPSDRLRQAGPQPGAARTRCGTGARDLRAAGPAPRGVPPRSRSRAAPRGADGSTSASWPGPTGSGSRTATTPSNACGSSTTPRSSSPARSPAPTSARAAAIPPAAIWTSRSVPGSPPSARWGWSWICAS